jgi:hypothetical protein
MQQFKGKYWIWDGVPKAPFRPGCLLTVDAECVKLTRKFPPSLFLANTLIIFLVLGFLSGRLERTDGPLPLWAFLALLYFLQIPRWLERGGRRLTAMISPMTAAAAMLIMDQIGTPGEGTRPARIMKS